MVYYDKRKTGGDSVMDTRELDKIAAEAKLEISHQIDSFISEIQKGTSNPDEFMTMSQIEEKMSLLRSSTTKTYSDILSTYLSRMDEKELIKRKKENTGKRG